MLTDTEFKALVSLGNMIVFVMILVAINTGISLALFIRSF